MSNRPQRKALVTLMNQHCPRLQMIAYKTHYHNAGHCNAWEPGVEGAEAGADTTKQNGDIQCQYRLAQY